MIGQISNITKFGLFVRFDTSERGKQKGLLRWSAVPKNLPKFQVGDFIGIEILKEHDDGKIDLSYLDKDFKKTFGTFIHETGERMEIIHKMNEELK